MSVPAAPLCALQLRVVREEQPTVWADALQQMLESPEGYKGLFAHLIAGISDFDFFDQVFERQCVHFSRGLSAVPPAGSKKRKAGDPPPPLDLFSDAAFLDTVERHGLHAANNVTITKYMNKKRIDYAVDEEDESPLTRAKLSAAFKAGFTCQFYQPQRFADSLYKINASFEHRLGSLAGASAYLTPPRSQGLEPHHDDVEVFVLQTQGSKRWRLHLGASASLPEVYAKGLPASRLTGGVEVTLNPGDVLYLPRGAIHEATAQEAFSTHVTISVCQHHSFKALVLGMMPRLCGQLFAEEEAFRRSLPPRMSLTLGSFVGMQQGGTGDRGGAGGRAGPAGAGAGAGAASGQAAEAEARRAERAAARAALLARVAAFASRLADLVTADALDAAADDFSADFVENRLPPPPPLPPGAGGGGGGTCSSSALRGGVAGGEAGRAGAGTGQLEAWAEGGVRLVEAACMHAQVEDAEDAEGQEGQEGRKVLALYLAAANDRLRHMGHPPGPGEAGGEGGDDDDDDDDDEEEEEEEEEDEDDASARFPVRFAPLVAALQLEPPHFVTAKDLAGQGLGLGEAEVRAALAELGAKGFLVCA